MSKEIPAGNSKINFPTRSAIISLGLVTLLLGKSPEERMRVLFAVWALAHGTATLLIAKATPPELAKELRAGCVNAVVDLLRAAKERAR